MAPPERERTSGDPSSGQGSAPVRAAAAAAVLLCIIAGFHTALLLGAPWGEYTQGGGATTGTLTARGRFTAALSAVLSIVMAGAVLARAGRGPLRRLPSRVTTVLAWFTTLYAAVAVLLNLVTRSDAERNLWAPVSILLLALVAYVMVTTRSGRRPAP